MVELETDAIHGPLEATLGVKQGIPLGRQNRQVLNVPPRERRTERQVIRAICQVQPNKR